jgi:hypothetical protein
MTAQDVFDRSYLGVLGQGGPSYDYWTEHAPEGGGGCRYRGRNGRRCAAGWLVPDELYDPRMEGKSWGTWNAEMFRPFPELAPHEQLIRELQSAHDNCARLRDDGFADEFRKRASGIAAARGLAVPPFPPGTPA